MRLLHGAWAHLDAVELEEPAPEPIRAAGPQRRHHLEVFVASGAALPRVGARGPVGAAIGPAGAAHSNPEDDAATGDGVEARDLLGEDRGISNRHENDAAPDPDAIRAMRHGCHANDRIQRRPPARRSIAHPYRVESEGLRRGSELPGRDNGEEPTVQDTELGPPHVHASPVSRPRATILYGRLEECLDGITIVTDSQV